MTGTGPANSNKRRDAREELAEWIPELKYFGCWPAWRRSR